MLNLRQNKSGSIGFVLFISVMLIGGCTSNPWGKVLKFDKGDELFYTSKVSADEVSRLGDYLLKIGLFQDEEPTIVQLTKEGDVYQLRVVTDREILNKNWAPDEMGSVEASGLLAEDISQELFNGAKVEWHLCDEKLKTLQVGSF